MISGLGEQELERLKEVINRLLAVNCLVKDLERDKYYFARRHRESLEQFFGFLGWWIEFDDRYECIFVSSPDSAHRRTLGRDESIWLLVLRLLYEEKRQGLSLSEHPVVTLHEIRSKYETFRVPFVLKTRLKDLVRLGNKYKLLQALDSEIWSDDCRFRLFHTLWYVVDADRVGHLHEKILRYEVGGEEGDDEVDEAPEAS